MEAQKFCLKWDGFQGSVTSVFDHLRQGSELVDITLCCEGQRVRAHRMMLSACSPYFRELFKEVSGQQLVVFLKDTSAADLTAIVEFMYKGSVNVAQSQLASFIKTAEMLQVQGLSGWTEDADPLSSYAPPPPESGQGRSHHQPPASPAASLRCAVDDAASPEPRQKRRRAEPPPAGRRASPPPPAAAPAPAPSSSSAAVNVSRPEETPQEPAAGQFENAVKVEKFDVGFTFDNDEERGGGEDLESALGHVAQYEGYDPGSDQSLSADGQLFAGGDGGPLSGNVARTDPMDCMDRMDRMDRMEARSCQDLGKILAKIEGIARTQQTILEAVRDSDRGVSRHMKRLRNIRELEELEQHLLRSPEIKAAMREQLSSLCSTDLRTSVKHIMTALFSPELAKQLSAKGQNNKKGLADTQIFDVLLETLFLVWKAPRQDVCRLVSRWLSGSRDRRSGAEPARKKRALLQSTATAPFERSPESAAGSSWPAEPT